MQDLEEQSNARPSQKLASSRDESKRLDRPIFIGGTGRSGTSIMRVILARHSQVFGHISETRFLIDPDGLLDLVHAISSVCTPAYSGIALDRFHELMRCNRKQNLSARIARRANYLTGIDFAQILTPARYGLQSLGAQLGLQHYDETVRQFVDSWTAYTFRGYWMGIHSFQWFPKMRGGTPLSPEVAARQAAEFVAELFRPAMSAAGNTRWCDDSPPNIFRIRELLALFPDLRFIHIFRDPRDVVASSLQKSWSPHDVHSPDRARFTLEKWREIRQQIPASSYFELRFEDMIAEPEATLRTLCDFLGLEFEPNLLNLDLSRHNIGRYRRDLSPELQKATEDRLREWMQEKNYPLSNAD
jgi:hypothetical protein